MLMQLNKRMPILQEDETGIPFAPPYDYARQPETINPTEWRHICPGRFRITPYWLGRRNQVVWRLVPI